MKRILIVHYSQSGQLSNVVESIAKPLHAASNIEVSVKTIKPVQNYPFPWPFLKFFNTFPESVYQDPPDIHPLDIEPNETFDLIILAYQVWFLSPSLPTSAFLQSEQAKKLLKGKLVITVIACRNMWLMAQEQVKKSLEKLHANLIDNVALVDDAHTAFTFISTPMWLLTGNKGPFLWGLVPKAGLTEEQIGSAARFGRCIATQLPNRASNDMESMLHGLQAVQVKESLIASEKIAYRSFRIWGRILRLMGNQKSLIRKFILIFYILFLITLIITVVPVSAVIKKLLKPITHQKIQQQRKYYAAPSGDSLDRMDIY